MANFVRAKKATRYAFDEISMRSLAATLVSAQSSFLSRLGQPDQAVALQRAWDADRATQDSLIAMMVNPEQYREGALPFNTRAFM
jgi:hypothetical protein